MKNRGAEIQRLRSENGRLTTQLELEVRKPKAGAARLDEEAEKELLVAALQIGDFDGIRSYFSKDFHDQ